MLKLLSRPLAVLVIVLCFSKAHGQETKVVVIPMFGDDIDQCRVATACDAGMATISCPSGGSVIACTVPKRVFVMSTVHDGNLGGLEGADGIGNLRADEQDISGVFKAWLSDDVQSPDDRFTHSTNPYVLVDGTVIATSYAYLIDDSLAAPIDVDERGLTALNMGTRFV
jgi:hypothetical protein